jgi:hypothetical protein
MNPCVKIFSIKIAQLIYLFFLFASDKYDNTFFKSTLNLSCNQNLQSNSVGAQVVALVLPWVEQSTLSRSDCVTEVQSIKKITPVAGGKMPSSVALFFSYRFHSSL